MFSLRFFVGPFQRQSSGATEGFAAFDAKLRIPVRWRDLEFAVLPSLMKSAEAYFSRFTESPGGRAEGAAYPFAADPAREATGAGALVAHALLFFWPSEGAQQSTCVKMLCGLSPAREMGASSCSDMLGRSLA